MKTAIIAGASGLVGKLCLFQLLETDQYSRVTALVRKPLPLKHHKLHQLVVDFDHLNDCKDELFANDVFCCLGTTIKVAGSQENFKKVDYYYPLELAVLTKQNGADTFMLISAMGANKDSSIFYNKTKGEIEHAIDTLDFNSFGILRPSLLLGDRNEFRLGEQIASIVMRVFGWLMVGPLKKYKAIHAGTVAKAMVNIAQDSSHSGMNIYKNDVLFRWGA